MISCRMNGSTFSPVISTCCFKCWYSWSVSHRLTGWLRVLNSGLLPTKIMYLNLRYISRRGVLGAVAPNQRNLCYKFHAGADSDAKGAAVLPGRGMLFVLMCWGLLGGRGQGWSLLPIFFVQQGQQIVNSRFYGVTRQKNPIDGKAAFFTLGNGW